jgi:small subunit ribosomal protein S17
MAEDSETPDEQDTPQDASEEAAQAEDAAQADAAAEPAEDAPQGAADADDGAESAEPADAGEPAAPAEQLSSKERRRRSRSSHSGAVNPPRSPEERQAERIEERRRKAVRRRARRIQERAKAVARRSGAPAGAEDLPPVHAPSGGTRRMRQGIVVSDKAEKTITVRIDVARRHRRYEKIVRSSSTVHAHDENNDAHEGDVVRVVESRPLSRTKRWALVDVLERAR